MKFRNILRFLYEKVSTCIFIVTNLYPLLTGKIKLNGAILRNCKLKSLTPNYRMTLGKGLKLINCEILFLGNNNLLSISNDGGGEIKNTTFWMQHEGSKIIIGNNFTMEGGKLSANEGKSILIGNDCMFSNGIDIRNGDGHAIRNLEGKRLNTAENIIIGNHVWLCAYAKILKGSLIPDNCIIGNSAVVSSKFKEKNVVYAGIPARKVKENITWTRWLE